MVITLSLQLNTLMQKTYTGTSVAATDSNVAAPLPDSSVPERQAAVSTSFSQLSRPEHFSGDSSDVKLFLIQCKLHSELQATNFPSDQAKIAFIISHLCCHVEAWTTVELSRRSVICSSLSFTRASEQIFHHSAPGHEAVWILITLKQGKRQVSDYAIKFRSLTVETEWGAKVFCDKIKDCMISPDLPGDLDSLVALAIGSIS